MDIKIAEVILEEYEKKDLRSLWEKNNKKIKFRNDCPLPKERLSDINNRGSDFEKELYLKEHFWEDLKNLDDKSFLDKAYWIIQKWGGISIKNCDENNSLILGLRKKIDDNRNKNENLDLADKEFEKISSLSKIAAFYNPEKFAIYDSRVVYSLNWFIYSNKIDTKYFPQPSGRNVNMLKYDQETIFNLSTPKPNYYEKKTKKLAYSDYCKILKDCAELSKQKKELLKIYEIEMFLFSIAPNEIVDCIKKEVEIHRRGR